MQIQFKKTMKQLLILLLAGTLFSCNDAATDGDPGTDTSVMRIDTNVYKDTSAHMNRRDGSVQADTSRGDSGVRRY